MAAELAMDMRRATRHYVSSVVSGIEGMKVLLMDKETIGMISMTYNQSELLEKDVFLFKLLEDSSRETLMHLKAVVFVRPTAENLELLQRELRAPKYSEYYLYFSNIVTTGQIQDLARADRLECVKQVKELYADYFTINRDFFTLNMPSVISTDPTTHARFLTRIREGLAAVLLSLKKKPIIRYQKNSELCQRVAQELSRKMVEERFLFDAGQRGSGAVLLLLDRRNDPVTPLLSQWTYQAMVHECLGIVKNRVRLQPAGEPKRPLADGDEPLDEVALSTENDDFFLHNMFLNWGEVCQNIRQLMQKVKMVDPGGKEIKSLEDMKRILENFPQFKQMKSMVSKHIAILEQLAGIVKARKLIDVSALEQEIVCLADHAAALRKVHDFLDSPESRELDKLKIAMLYALRYESQAGNGTNDLLAKLEQKGVDRSAIALVPALLRYAGVAQRSADIFGEGGSWMDRMGRLGDRIATGLKGVENIYTMHKPYLNTIIAELLASKLSEPDYPAMADSPALRQRPSHIIIFYVGGATYEEAASVAKMNIENPSTCVILGGTTVHNSASFLEEVNVLRSMAKPF